MPRKNKPRGQSTRWAAPISVRIPHATLAAVDKAAAELSVPRSAVLIDAIESWLERPTQRPVRRRLRDARAEDAGGGREF